MLGTSWGTPQSVDSYRDRLCQFWPPPLTLGGHAPLVPLAFVLDYVVFGVFENKRRDTLGIGSHSASKYSAKLCYRLGRPNISFRRPTNRFNV